MMNHIALGIGLASLVACGNGGGTADAAATPIDAGAVDATNLGDGAPIDPSASFFVTSVGNDDAAGNYGGLAGADVRCNALAVAAGLTGRTWAAYLSTPAQDARDRIGLGPWFNTRSELIANDVNTLHNTGIPAAQVIDENGVQIDVVNAHDILTGSAQNGRFTSLPNCNDFATNDPSVFTTVGHSNGGGVGEGGIAGNVSGSWNSAHITQCDRVGMQATAGRAHLYCFALP